MKRLVEQVTGYAALVEKHLDLFQELYSVVLGREVVLETPCERWIVWPSAARYARDPREDELAKLGIRVVGYVESGDGYELRVGRAVRYSTGDRAQRRGPVRPRPTRGVARRAAEGAEVRRRERPGAR